MNFSSNQDYSNVGYYFLMFMADYYKRVGNLNLSFDEMMVLNTVASHLAYNLDSSQTLSVEEMLNLKNEKIQKIHHKSKLSILSIANILDQPKESVRRRVNKLIKLNLIIKDKKTNGIMLTEKYREIIKKFGVVTTNKFILLIQNMDKNNFLSEILNDNKKNIKIVEALDNIN